MWVKILLMDMDETSLCGVRRVRRTIGRAAGRMCVEL